MYTSYTHCLQAEWKNLIDHREQGVNALAACVARLRQEVPVDTPILCLGYSAGGMVALDYARSGADVAGIILCSALLKTAATGMDTRINREGIFPETSLLHS
jgi:pimeloyl-ACP methyl ester carboxylesterase